MDIQCVLKTVSTLYSNEQVKEIKVKSTWSCRKNTVVLVVDDKEFEVYSDELIKAINNCTNY